MDNLWDRILSDTGRVTMEVTEAYIRHAADLMGIAWEEADRAIDEWIDQGRICPTVIDATDLGLGFLPGLRVFADWKAS